MYVDETEEIETAMGMMVRPRVVTGFVMEMKHPVHVLRIVVVEDEVAAVEELPKKDREFVFHEEVVEEERPRRCVTTKKTMMVTDIKIAWTMIVRRMQPVSEQVVDDEGDEVAAVEELPKSNVPIE